MTQLNLTHGYFFFCNKTSRDKFNNKLYRDQGSHIYIIYNITEGHYWDGEKQ